jgi:hypothetical protein
MSFRVWLQEMWYLHINEIEQWTGRGPTYNSQEYFTRNKWWLRQAFRQWQNRDIL